MNNLSVNVDAVKRVLAGKPAALYGAFMFARTKEGAAYWMQRAEGLVELTNEDRKFLKSLVPHAPRKAPKPNTQVAQIIDHIRRKGYITQRDAHIDYGVQSFTRRIRDIRELGYKVVKERSRHPTTGQLYYRYSFAA